MFFFSRKRKIDENVLLIDKPKGITSFDVIRELRKKLKEDDFRHSVPKIGHAGTLDPLASGLLIVAKGEATKKLNKYIKLSKTYEVIVKLGESRTTGDMEGEVTATKAISNFDVKKTKEVMSTLVGTLCLRVPKYSAVKDKGEPLYKKARRGEQFVAPEKEMEVTSIVLNGVEKEGIFYLLHATMKVGSGAYVRSIVEELGDRLGYPAVVKELRRTKIGKYSVKDAQLLHE